MLQKSIYRKLEQLPENLQVEILSYIENLISSSFKSPPELKERPFGFAKGTFIISNDFDEPLEDLKEYM